ncbi:MAG: hypothetical protein D6680_03020 [Cyanobacteria bacterium J007]|jgi:hypothetical protein|nr:MAG: hypothetical protein D6680_03020 [Cyanobacteria bacterium J007]
MAAIVMGQVVVKSGGRIMIFYHNIAAIAIGGDRGFDSINPFLTLKRISLDGTAIETDRPSILRTERFVRFYFN